MTEWQYSAAAKIMDFDVKQSEFESLHSPLLFDVGQCFFFCLSLQNKDNQSNYFIRRFTV